MRYEQRVIIRFLHNEKVDPHAIHQRLHAQFGLDTYGLRTVQYWCQLFTLGRDDLHEKDRPGRPPIDYVDAEILGCLQKEPFSSSHSLAQTLNLSQSTVLDRLHNSLGMNNWHVRKIPHELTDDLRRTKVSKCRELLNALERMAASAFRDIVTGDESWFYFCHHLSTQWSISREDVACAVIPGINTSKFMLAIIWEVSGFHVVDLMTSQDRFDSQYFVDHVMIPLTQKIVPGRRRAHVRRLNVPPG
jgi:hypothetical protein